MDHIEDLRASLAANLADLKSGKIEVKTAAEINNTAGKIISTVLVQLKFHELAKSEPKIDFVAPRVHKITEGA